MLQQGYPGLAVCHSSFTHDILH